jgi:hypothetical protein
MGDLEDQLAEWAITGNQKAAMLRVLAAPMPAKVILMLARKISPSMTMRDLLVLLHVAQEKGVVRCLTPKRIQGKLYYPTPLGRQAVKIAFGMHLGPLPDEDWEAYSYILSGESRFHVFTEVLAQDGSPRRITDVKFALRGERGLTLNQASRALAELQAADLVRVCGLTKRRASKLYSYTDKGQSIINVMRSFGPDNPFSLFIRGEGKPKYGYRKPI